MPKEQSLTPNSPHQETLALYSSEQLPQSQLQESFREERAAWLYESMERTANRLLEASRIDTVDALLATRKDGDPLEEVKGGSTFALQSNLVFPGVKMLMNNLAEFAGQPTSLEHDIVSPPQGEERLYGLTPNLDLSLEYKDGGSIFYRLQPSEGATDTAAEEDAKRVVGFLAEKDAQSDSFRDEIKERLAAGESEAFATHALTFEKDSVDLMALLQATKIGALSSTDFRDPLLLKPHGYKKIIEKIYRLPAHYQHDERDASKSTEGIHFTQDGSIDRVVLGTGKEGLSVVLKNPDPADPRDLSELRLVPGLSLDLAREYNRTQDGNNIYREGARPFLETPTAAQLLASFEKAGLTPSQRIKDSFMELGEMDDRWGQGYADLTREIGKLVNDQERSLKRLFEAEDEVALQQAVASLEDIEDPAAQVVVEMLRGVATRDAGSNDGVALPVSKERIEVRDGSCKDAEVYIVGGVSPYEGPDEELLFLDSSYKEPSTLTLRQTVLNGVRIPAGSLLAKREDGYLLLRVTSFAFTPEQAATVFGSQDTENRSWDYSYDFKAADIRSAIQHLEGRE